MVGLGNLSGPQVHPVLYLRWVHSNASPKAISGRTSYLQVRLAFHPYPQLIRTFCNRCRFGPPRALTRASPWPWVAHLVSGLPPATHVRPFRLGFPAGPGDTPLPSPETVTRRFVLQKARDHARDEPQHALAVCQRTVSGSVSLPSAGCFSPFPHGTGALSVGCGI